MRHEFAPGEGWRTSAPSRGGESPGLNQSQRFGEGATGRERFAGEAGEGLTGSEIWICSGAAICLSLAKIELSTA